MNAEVCPKELLKTRIIKYIRWKIAEWHGLRKPSICWGKIATWALFPEYYPWHDLYDDNFSCECEDFPGWCMKCSSTGRLQSPEDKAECQQANVPCLVKREIT